MVDFRPIIFVIGFLMLMLSAAMVIPFSVDLIIGHPDWRTFATSFFVSASLGGMMVLANRSKNPKLTLRQAFLLTTLTWVILPAVAALPLAFSELQLSFTDAYFEAMSGLTTTGSTVIEGLDDAPPGILLWRSLLQWLGGVGIVVTAVAVLPMLQVGGMQLFRMESSDTSEKILPRAAQISGAIAGFYIFLTATCTLALFIAGLSIFDSITHAMTTIATGGFSTHDASVGHFDSALVDGLITCFMLLGSLPFVLYLQAVRGRPMALWRDDQVRAFAGTVFVLVGFIVIWLTVGKGFALPDALRYGSFNTVSIITGTGYATTDFGDWGNFSTGILFFAMVIGGCAGSTSCGIKIFRFQVVLRSLKCWADRAIYPNGVFVARFNGRRIGRDVQGSVVTFLFFFFVSMMGLSFLLTLTGLDLVTALSGASTAIANVGPGLGPDIGPATTFKDLPDTAKWLLSCGMLLGRLEMFTVLVLFTPSFWRA